MVDLELQYLFEIGRISLPANKILTTLQADIGLQIADDSFQYIVQPIYIATNIVQQSKALKDAQSV